MAIKVLHNGPSSSQSCDDWYLNAYSSFDTLISIDNLC